MSEELQDLFGGGGGGAPVISLKGAKKGTSFSGLIVPADVLGEPDSAYQTTQQTSMQGEPLYWPPRGQKGKGKTLAEFKALGVAEEPRPMSQTEVTLLTAYREREFMSDAATERAIEREQEDDGVRRWIVKGPSAPKKFQEAVRATRSPKPEVGARVTVTVAKFVKNDHGGDSYEFEVTYQPPTEETLADVKAYIEATIAAGGAAAAGDDEAPF